MEWCKETVYHSIISIMVIKYLTSPMLGPTIPTTRPRMRSQRTDRHHQEAMPHRTCLMHLLLIKIMLITRVSHHSSLHRPSCICSHTWVMVMWVFISLRGLHNHTYYHRSTLKNQ